MEFIAYVTPLCAQPRASSGQVCVGVMLLILLQRCKRSVVSLGCYLLASVLQSCCGPLGSVQRRSMGWWSSPSPGWGDASGHRSVRGIFHELIGDIVTSFCGVVLGLAGSEMTWQNSQEMGRNRGAKGNRAIKSSQKEQNVCCAKNTQPRCWRYISWQWRWAVSRWWMGRGRETDLLGEIWWPKVCWGSGEKTWWASARWDPAGGVWGDSPVCLGWDFGSAGHPGLRGAEQMLLHQGNVQRVEGQAVQGSAHHPASVGHPDPLGGHLPRACGFGTEAPCVQCPVSHCVLFSSSCSQDQRGEGGRCHVATHLLACASLTATKASLAAKASISLLHVICGLTPLLFCAVPTGVGIHFSVPLKM